MHQSIGEFKYKSARVETSHRPASKFSLLLLLQKKTKIARMNYRDTLQEKIEPQRLESHLIFLPTVTFRGFLAHNSQIETNSTSHFPRTKYMDSEEGFELSLNTRLERISQVLSKP